MSYNFDSYEDQPTDELLYGRCKKCHQIEELNEDELCLVCEGLFNGTTQPYKSYESMAE